MKNSSFLNAINTKTVTKLVLLGEIIAICVLHSVKMNQGSKILKEAGNIYTLPKKFSPPSNVSFANNKELLRINR